MKKKILLVCLMFLMTFLMILPVQAKKRVVKAEAYASRMNLEWYGVLLVAGRNVHWIQVYLI